MNIAEEPTAHPAVRVAVIGDGSWAENLAREFARSVDWALVALCHMDRDRAAGISAAVGGLTVVDSVDELLADVAFDAVAMAIALPARHEIALQVMAAGKNVVMESLLAPRLSQARELVDTAQGAGTVLMTDSPHCYTPAVLTMRELIRAGELGEVLYVDSVRIDFGLGRSNLDVFWDLAPHGLSILDVVLPGGLTPAAVSAQGADPLRAGRTCVGYLSLPLSGGGLAHVHVNWLSPTRIRQMVIGGSKKTLIWDDLKPQQRLTIVDRVENGDNPSSALGIASSRQGSEAFQVLGRQQSPPLPDADPQSSMIASFAEAIRAKVPAPTEGPSALRVLSILEAATESLAAGGANMPLSNGGPVGTSVKPSIALEAVL
jgi:predicted dehydrogenase